MPRLAVLGDAAAADQAMNMRVQVQLLGPGMQHGEHRDGAADVTRIAGEFDDRGGARLRKFASYWSRPRPRSHPATSMAALHMDV